MPTQLAPILYKADFVSVVLADTEDTWNEVFAAVKSSYVEPKLVLFSDSVDSACGFAQAAMGPFYCPADSKVYIDLAFYRDYLPGYLRILGANEKGREVINRIKEQDKTIAVSNLSKEIKNLTAEDLKIAQTERKAYALYHLFDQKYCDDYSLKPVIVK